MEVSPNHCAGYLFALRVRCVATREDTVLFLSLSSGAKTPPGSDSHADTFFEARHIPLPSLASFIYHQYLVRGDDGNHESYRACLLFPGGRGAGGGDSSRTTAFRVGGGMAASSTPAFARLLWVFLFAIFLSSVSRSASKRNCAILILSSEISCAVRRNLFDESLFPTGRPFLFSTTSAGVSFVKLSPSESLIYITHFILHSSYNEHYKS